jgi:predicted amidohydrolase YtcJ
MKKFLVLVIFGLLLSCDAEKSSADLLIKNGTVYTVNENFDVVEAIVVNEGKIVAVGSLAELEAAYIPSEIYDASGKTVLPGLIDAHAHLFNLGRKLQNVDLVDTKSFEEVIERVVAFQNENKRDFIIGRGWDQNDWEVKEFPTNEVLDSLFPDIPLALQRIDGHASIVNSMVLDFAKITADSKMEGGEVILKDGKPTGVLVDNARANMYGVFPDRGAGFVAQALIDGEKLCLELGLTTVNDAGLSRLIIETIDSLQQAATMKIRVYAMASNYPANLDYFLDERGIIKTDRLHVRSIKVYGDGALGSRGAAMRAEYSDQAGQFGGMITTQEELMVLAKRIAAAGYQMNSHAIGDSANVSVIRAYQEALKDKKDARWKIEHAQVITPADFDAFSNNIIPSVQPTHATSDMYWAEDRVGSERIQGAYAYKTLLDKAGIIVLGTDFPVERVNPMHTFYAAVARKDLQNYPDGGYRMEEALTREETLRGMTIWAAYSNFEENEKGSIEVGKFADFTIMEQDIMEIPEDAIPNAEVTATIINGEVVYKRE